MSRILTDLQINAADTKWHEINRIHLQQYAIVNSYDTVVCCSEVGSIFPFYFIGHTDKNAINVFIWNSMPEVKVLSAGWLAYLPYGKWKIFLWPNRPPPCFSLLNKQREIQVENEFSLLKLKPHLLLITLVLNIKIGVIEFFAFNTKLPEIAMLVSKDFAAVKKVTSSGAQLEDH